MNKQTSPAQPTYKLSQLHIHELIALTLWAEAYGEPIRTMEAIANVIGNRLQIARQRSGYWWGNSWINICLSPSQFQCWVPRTIQHNRFATLSSAETDHEKLLQSSYRISYRLLNNALKDITKGATYFHRSYEAPDWSKNHIPTAVIGGMSFYHHIA